MASELWTKMAGTYQPTILKGKLALITGATGGIGQATARLFASRGLNVAIHYFSAPEKAQALVDELTSPTNPLNLAHGPVKAIAFQANLGDMDEVRKLHAEVVDKMGGIDVLYNNAAMGGKNLGIGGRIEQIDVDELELVWRVNVKASFLLTQLCIPHMEAQKFGRVVFCSSIAAATGGVVSPAYASSKSALHGMMHWIAKQYCRSGITCNAVAPALIANTVMFPDPSEDHRNLIPMGRFGMPEEIASVVELLISNAYMTNKIVVADGGMLPSALA